MQFESRTSIIIILYFSDCSKNKSQLNGSVPEGVNTTIVRKLMNAKHRYKSRIFPQTTNKYRLIDGLNQRIVVNGEIFRFKFLE